MATTCTDFVRRILQYVKGPDGKRAGDIRLFRGMVELFPWILEGQLWSDILNFDIDTLITASIKCYYKGPIFNPFPILGSTIETFYIWKKILIDVVLEHRDREKALNRLDKYFQSRLQIYQSDWRLQLLLTLEISNFILYSYLPKSMYRVPYCRCLDILLEMDNHDLHLVDQDALDLRHAYMAPWSRLIGTVSPYVNGDTYASAAAHCMRFLSNPPKHSEKHECPETGLTYAEWKETCDMTLEMFYKLLQEANTSSELVKFISDHDIHSEIQKDFPTDRILEVNLHILAFLSRAGVSVSWRIISAIQLSQTINDRPPSKFHESDERPNEPEDLETRH